MSVSFRRVSILLLSVFIANIFMWPVQAANKKSSTAIKQTHTSQPYAPTQDFLGSGIASYRKGYIAKAIPEFEQATRQFPHSEIAFLWLARSYQRQGGKINQRKAEIAFEKVLSLNPNNGEALVSLGQLWSWDPKKRSQAIVLLERAIRIQPGNAATAKKLSEALLWQALSEEALVYIPMVDRKYPNDQQWQMESAQIKVNAALAYATKGENSKAQILYQQLHQGISKVVSRNENEPEQNRTHDEWIQDMAALAFILNLPSDTLQWDQSLPLSVQRKKNVEIRDARALIQLSRSAEAIERFMRLNEAGLLATEEKKEFLDVLKSKQTQPALAEGSFKQLLSKKPNDRITKAAYAEYLSWQVDKRTEALKLYLELAESNIAQAHAWEAPIEQVLQWQEPSISLMPIYQKLANLYPKNVMVQLTMARAYRSDKKNAYKEAIAVYSELVKQHGDNAPIRREWLDLLLSDPARRKESLHLLSDRIQRDNSDQTVELDVLSSYGKLLSYERQYKKAMAVFQQVLAQKPEDHDALVGKGYVLLWRGDPLEAKAFFKKLDQEYPHDTDIALGLAQANKQIGRYDEAFQIMQNLKNDRLLHSPPREPKAPSSSNASENLKSLSFFSPQDEIHQQVEYISLNPELQGKTRGYDVPPLPPEKTVPGMKGNRSTLPLEEVTLEQTSEHHANPFSGRSLAYGLNEDPLNYDTNPLLSGLGRFTNTDVQDLEKSLTSNLRPLIRGGYLYSHQDGGATTSQLSGWGFPNQTSFSLTSQIRIRGGITPMHYALKNGVPPNQTWGTEYAVGATVKYWDRLTLDGDVALTHFTQANVNNMTFWTQAKYDFTDRIRVSLGMRRLPETNSLLALTGLRPNIGAFQGEVLGLARENTLLTELNTNPFNHNWDWNLAYAWSFISGSHIPNNTKNQIFTSFGHTWHYGEKQQIRLGYEFLYFGYAKNATDGFFDTTSSGVTQPVVNLHPVELAGSGYVFGGYYSPIMFLLNAGRLDLQGSLWHQFLEYQVGGGLGVRNAVMGHGITGTSGKGSGNGAAMSKAFNINLILNITDWLALYGNVDYLDAGGFYNRWRLGGGLIVRPRLNRLSPLIGSHSK